MEKHNIKTLLALYEQHPCLYAIKCIDYHNRNKREIALQLIAQSYEEITKESITTDNIKKKINGLRAQYLEQRQKIKQSKASGASTDDIYKPTWWAYEYMKFFDPYIVQRKGESSLTKKVCKNNVFESYYDYFINIMIMMT